MNHEPRMIHIGAPTWMVIGSGASHVLLRALLLTFSYFSVKHTFKMMLLLLLSPIEVTCKSLVWNGFKLVFYREDH